MNGDNARVDTPSCEPSLEIANNHSQSIRDTLSDIEGMVLRIEDFLCGSRPEKPQESRVEGVASGVLAQLCNQGADNLDRLQDIHRRLDRMAGNLGVQR
jgi:hypothetical protein